jgi:hypothetical protein
MQGIIGYSVWINGHKSGINVQKYGCNYILFVLAWCLFEPYDEEDAMRKTQEKPTDDPWDAFELDDDELECEPEPGDFWGELDDDCDGIG